MKPLKLNGAALPQPNKLQRSALAPAKAVGAGASLPASDAADSITVSNRAEEVGRLVAKVAELSDLRQERIEPLRQQIASGTYSVPASDIADAILKDEQ